MTVPTPFSATAPHLAQFFHQVRLGVQPARGVGQHDVDVARCGALDGVEHHRARVAALGPADDLGVGALGPRRQLLGCGGAERVAGGEQHGTSGIMLLARDLADGGGLADPVDADEQPHVDGVGGTGAIELAAQRAVRSGQARDHLVAQSVDELPGCFDALVGDLGAQVLEQVVSDADPDVGTQQRLFEIVPRLVGDRGAAEDAADRSGERRTGLRQPFAQRRRAHRFDDLGFEELRFDNLRFDDGGFDDGGFDDGGFDDGRRRGGSGAVGVVTAGGSRPRRRDLARRTRADAPTPVHQDDADPEHDHQDGEDQEDDFDTHRATTLPTVEPDRWPAGRSGPDGRSGGRAGDRRAAAVRVAFVEGYRADVTRVIGNRDSTRGSELSAPSRSGTSWRCSTRPFRSVARSTSAAERARSPPSSPSASASHEMVGIDRSPTMLAEAERIVSDRVRFEFGDIGRWTSTGDRDLVFANAALHWVPDHPAVLARWVAALRPGGQLAVQVPANNDHASHLASSHVAHREPFLSALGGDPPPDPVEANVLPPEAYAELLIELGIVAPHVRLQVYTHLLPSSASVVEWTRGTSLTRFFERLPDELHEPFVDAYRDELLARIGDHEPYLFTFKRSLMWGVAGAATATRAGSR